MTKISCIYRELRTAYWWGEHTIKQRRAPKATSCPFVDQGEDGEDIWLSAVAFFGVQLSDHLGNGAEIDFAAAHFR